MVPDMPLFDSGKRVRALTGTLTRLGIALALADDEQEADALVEQIEAITACVIDSEAVDLDEVRAKASVLRHRVGEHLSPENPAEALTMALAASVVRDLDRLAA
jgi:Asp-tRNA(Asn)/Glu-tRNA(Gln) amidotransferase C subunit